MNFKSKVITVLDSIDWDKYLFWWPTSWRNEREPKLIQISYVCFQDDLWTQRSLSTFQTFARGQDQKRDQHQSTSTTNGFRTTNKLPSSNLEGHGYPVNNSINGHGSLSSSSPSSVSSNGSPKHESTTAFRNGYSGGNNSSKSLIINTTHSNGGGTMGRSNGINKAKPFPVPTLNPTHLRSRSVEGPVAYSNESGIVVMTLPGPTSIPTPAYHSHSLSYSSMDSDFNMSTYMPTDMDVSSFV